MSRSCIQRLAERRADIGYGNSSLTCEGIGGRRRHVYAHTADSLQETARFTWAAAFVRPMPFGYLATTAAWYPHLPAAERRGQVEPISLTPLVSAILAAANLAVGAGGLYLRHWRKLSTFKDLAQRLRAIGPADDIVERDIEDSALLEWLDRAGVVIAPLKARLMARLLWITLSVIGGSIILPLNLPGELLPTSRALEPVDLAIILGQVLASVANSTGILLRPVERDFLKHLSRFYSYFYDMHVLPRLRILNRQAVSMDPWGKVRVFDDREQREIERIVDDAVRSRGPSK